MLRIAACLLLLAPLYCPQTALAQVRSGGFITNAAMYAATSRFHQHLEYSDDEQRTLQAMGLHSFHDERTKEVRRHIRQFSQGTLESHFKNNLLGRSQKVAEFNAAVLQPVEDLLASAKRIHRFRQLMTQLLMWAGDLDAVIRYNNLDVNFEQYGNMIEEYRKREAEIPPMEFLRYRAALPYLRQVLGDENLEKLVGNAYPGELEVQTTAGRPMSAVDNRVTLLGRITIHQELDLTVGQVQELVLVLKSLQDETRNSTKILTAAAAFDDKDEFFNEQKHFREQVQSRLGRVLNHHQLQRLEELAFQSRIRCLELENALAAAGFGRESEDLPDNVNNWIQIEAHFSQQILGFNAGFLAIARGVGFETARDLCGKPEIERDGTRYLYPDQHDRIMIRVKQRIPFATEARLPREQGVNPRRQADR